MSASQPLVSVVTPVYNGDKHLAECIESVLSQTYQNWEYVIVNNCSTDQTSTIGRSYAEKDERIRIHNNKEFLDLIPNWNHALKQISSTSKYCKIVHADDRLFPECISHMVNVAEENPSVGMVGAYVLKGNRIQGDGLPYPSTVVPGDVICRATLLKEVYLFGSPTSTMIRSDIIRQREQFYNEKNFHADVEAGYEILQEHDFGFVHEVLTYTRLHDESQTVMVADKLNTNILENLGMLMKYGPSCFNENEYEGLLKKRLKAYYRVLVRCALKGKGAEVLNYHKQSLEKIGLEFDKRMYIKAMLVKFLDMLLNPKKTIEGLYLRLRK